ncbi:sensor histidine kinase [Granulicella sibirica]|uniref:sensor histidine kinase n=1 Tax=Granulicella sibirica TaxID=2479048 RepID=UPI00137627A5|nr:HAMP domain-containing sensor histidine kinase [Granulicella sibirica]
MSILLLGLAMLLKRNPETGGAAVTIADILTLLAVTLAGISMIEYVTGPLPLYEQWNMANIASARPGSIPGRMSVGTILGVTMLSVCLFALDRVPKLCTALLSFGIMLALAAVCGFLYKARQLAGGRILDAMSVQTAISLLALYSAAFASRPLREPMLSLFAPELGAEARMELLIGTWALPILIGLMVKLGYQREWYEVPFALGLFAVAVVSLQTFLIWRSDFALTRLTRNKQKLEEVLRKNEKLAVAGRLAASISHEINNPLEAISNLLFLIRTSDGLEEQHRYADMATEELRRVSQITTQTLSFYRESTRPELAEIVPILESSVQLLRGKIKSLGLQVVEEYTEPIPQLVCSPGELRQVVVNLISNALDATPRDGRIVVRASRSRSWTRAGTNVVRIAIADSGSGMPPEVLARVFEPFYTTKEKTGNGLGLWVAADLVEKQGGWMKVRSITYGRHKGTTFAIVLPLIEAGSDFSTP